MSSIPLDTKSRWNSSEVLALTVTEVSDAINVSPATVYRLIQRRKLRCLKSVRHKRIPATELQRFLQEDSR